MRTLDFVIHEGLRRGRKSAAGIAYVLLAVSIFVASQTINKALHDRTKEQLLRFGANIIVQPRGSAFDLGSGVAQGGILLPDLYSDKIRNIEHKKMLVAVSPKLFERVEIAGQSLLVVGVTAEEFRAKPWWMVDKEPIGNRFLDEGSALLGHHAAQRLGEKLDDIELAGRTFRVSGVLDETGSQDDFMLFVPLVSLQKLSRKTGMVNMIEVSTSCIACKSMNISDVAKDIRNALPSDAEVMLVSQIAEAQMGTLRKVQAFTMITYLVVLTLAIFLLVNSASASVDERRREIGILMAIGMAPRKIQQIFLFKVFTFAVIGGVLGFVLGTGLSVFMGPVLAGSKVYPILKLLPIAIGMSVGLGVISSILPVRKIAGIDPVEALREL